MYKSYLFCANYALFVLSTFVDRATHSDVSWLFLVDAFNVNCTCRFQILLPKANNSSENLDKALR